MSHLPQCIRQLFYPQFTVPRPSDERASILRRDGDLHVHLHTDPALVELLRQAMTSLAFIHTKLDKQGVLLMAVSPQIQAFSDKFDVATNEIAADLQALRDKIAAGTPLTPEDTALLDEKIARLTVLGQDPENPVPTEPPTV